MDDRGILGTISYIIPETSPSEDILLNVNLFNHNLQSIEPENGLSISFNKSLLTNAQYTYFKSIYLKSDYVMFAYIFIVRIIFGIIIGLSIIFVLIFIK